MLSCKCLSQSYIYLSLQLEHRANASLKDLAGKLPYECVPTGMDICWVGVGGGGGAIYIKKNG